MKRQSYKVTINNPCEKEWASMTQNGTGRHCSHCSTTVVDFTQLTDNEIVHIIKQTPGRLCGRLTNQQLNRSLETTHHSNNSWFYKILAGFVLIATSEKSIAKDNPTSPEKIFSTTNNEKSTPIKPKTDELLIADSLKNSVQGTVFEGNSKKPLSFVTVLIKGTEIRTQTDHNGKFKLIIPDSLTTEKIKLAVMYIGFGTIETTIKRKKLPIIKDFSIVPELNYIGEIIITRKKKWWQR
jgi:hypothetical protein